MTRPTLEGYVAQRWTPEGRFVGVCGMSFGKGRIVVGDEYTVEECWCYESVPAALAAFEAWDADKRDEPDGWFRSPTTGRRRPNGDASKEYFLP